MPESLSRTDQGVAKGCRKLKNRFGAALEPFTLINLTYYEKEHQELVSFRQVEILKSRFNLSSNASILTGFSYMGDLLIDFSPPHQANDNLFRMALACFEAVSEILMISNRCCVTLKCGC